MWQSVREVFFNQGKEQEKARAPAMENLKYLEEQLEGKKFFGGEKIGILDLVLGWMANLLSILEEITGQNLINQEKFPLLWKWIHDFSNVPVIKENWPSRDKLITKFQTMRDAYLAAATAASKLL